MSEYSCACKDETGIFGKVWSSSFVFCPYCGERVKPKGIEWKTEQRPHCTNHVEPTVTKSEAEQRVREAYEECEQIVLNAHPGYEGAQIKDAMHAKLGEE